MARLQPGFPFPKAMAMLRSATGIALRRSAPLSRFFISASTGCSDAAAAVRRSAPVSRFFSSVSHGCSEAAAAVRRPVLAPRGFTNGGRGCPGNITGRKMSSYASGGSKGYEGGSSSKVFQQQDYSTWKISNVLFWGIAAGVMLTVRQNVRVQQEERWKREKAHKTETPAPAWMMDEEKAENVMNSWTRC